MARDVAIAIGVAKSGDLVPLPGAIQGAKDFAAWARDPDGGGFDPVILLTDEGDETVTGSRIYDAIYAEVKDFGVRKLFLFFAGHGVSLGLDVDYWLLSPGPADTTNGAVNVAKSIRLARRLGIPHVAIFADHCRTTADKRRQGVAGYDIFPNLDKVPEKFDLDQFYAALPGDPSQEVTDTEAEKSFGIFTQVLMRALTGGEDGAADLVSDNGEVRRAVVAFKLRDWIVAAVEEATEEIPGARVQTPDPRPGSVPPNVLAWLPTPDSAHLEIVAAPGDPPPGSVQLFTAPDEASSFNLAAEGALPIEIDLEPGTFCRVELVDAPPAHRQDERSSRGFRVTSDLSFAVSLEPDAFRSADAASVRRSTVLDATGVSHVAAPSTGVFEVRTRDHLTGRVVVDYEELKEGDRPRGYVAANAAAEEAAARFSEAVGRLHFETGVGLSVVGAELDPNDPLGVAVSPDGHRGVFLEDGKWHVRAPFDTSGSAVVHVGEGRRAAVAMLAGFIGTLVIQGPGVRHVGYAPTEGSPYDVGAEEADAQRRAMAIASVAASNGRFDVAVDEALEVAAVLRRYKHMNPTLGILAAYAYDRAGRYDQIEDMIGYFVDAGQPVPYDLVMLAGLTSAEVDALVVPSYPMLTQGWAYLDAEDLPDAVRLARASLAPSLWATPTGDGGLALAEAVQQGELR